MKSALRFLVWLGIALLGAGAYATIAFRRGEPLNSGFVIVAALCTYALGYRFYSKWIAAKVLALDDRRATPCEVHEDGKDFCKTNKWIVFGHHFAAISGPGPLVGPVLAAQFGYLPGTLWLLIGAVLGGAVQDFIILFASMRRDGRSLGQMVKEELNNVAGAIGVVAILSIMIILLAVLALVVVNAMADSPWSVFTVGATIPIAMFMGGYLRFMRIGKVLEVSVIGVVLLFLAVWGGQAVHANEGWHQAFKLSKETLAWSVIVYGFFASVLPVWLLLAPRDYLSTFMKLGTIVALALGTLLVLPDLQMPALTKFIDGTGPVVPGKLFPFCFITVACGAISGFHTLISSGITPKIISREGHARPIGYGAMCLESLVAIMAMIAACTLEPGTYLAMNIAGGDPAVTTELVAQSGLKSLQLNDGGTGYSMERVTVSPEEMKALATQMGEVTLFGRTGGAATLAVGMAKIFAELTHGRWLDLWYHFALMFEALFILTTLDAGTRVGRYLLQDSLGKWFPALGNVKSMGAGIFASALIVIAWGFFLIMGVRDPDGGVKALWPIFGIANQLLASIALCLATTILIKMQLKRGRSPALALVTLIPLAWLLTVTLTAATLKVLPSSKISFFAAAANADRKVKELEAQASAALQNNDTALAQTNARPLKAARTVRFNNTIDGIVTCTFLALVVSILLLAISEWQRLLSRRKDPVLSETDPIWLPPDPISPSPVSALGAAAIAFTLARELSGQADLDRAQARAELCDCAAARTPSGRKNVFLTTLDARYRDIRRCC